jgi:hypothetical protein
VQCANFWIGIMQLITSVFLIGWIWYAAGRASLPLLVVTHVPDSLPGRSIAWGFAFIARAAEWEAAQSRPATVTMITTGYPAPNGPSPA